MYGWAGKLLRIDLTTRTATTEAIPDDQRKLFLGGRGVNSRILYREVPIDCDPLGPENRLIFGTGPLSGTRCPSSPRCTVSALSPLTGILGDANFGGFFAPYLKKVGFDHLVIQGVADEPIFVLITERGVAFHNATHLWGMGTSAAEQKIRQELGIPELQVAVIGQAGEKGVRMACLVHHYNVAGRTGMGAVMGSKNLKAICIAGGGKLAVARPEHFETVRKQWLKKIADNPYTKFFGTYGSAGPLEREESAGILAVKNFSQIGGLDGIERISAIGIKKYLTSSHSCFLCPVHCIQGFSVPDGPYAGTRGAKLTEGCNSSCGPSCGNTDPGSLFKLNVMANDYGIDILDFGLLTAIAMDWYENGIITAADTDGIELTWGNHQAMVMMMEKIARREGIGNILADGAVKAAEHIGKDAQSYVNACKGMVFGGVDPRVLRGSALCYATATRGGDHLRGGVLVELPRSDGTPAIPEEEARERFGTADVLDPLSYNKASAAVFCQDMYTIADCLEVCKFITAHNGHGITMQDMADMLHAVTGMQLDIADMHTVAHRVFTLERAFLARLGIRKKDDFLRGKWTRGPVHGGRYAGAALDREQWERMLEQYYLLRKWDPATGIPLPETLRELDLPDVAQDMEKLLCRCKV
ncbi:MAG: aldehyde ferredoxin oxidoreductase family protein [Desulfobacterota bacterium]|nr:aldehyde ferredoxin oxidoreductase family protein [Thermodesulfobacteriota bacterium]